MKKRSVRRFVKKRRPRRSGRDPAADLAVDPDVLGDATVASLKTIASHSAAATALRPAQMEVLTKLFADANEDKQSWWSTS